MAGFKCVRIHGSVGKDGVNMDSDIRAVQDLLNAHLPMGLSPLVVDGEVGEQTIAVITAVERMLLTTREPDERLGPVGPTLRRLNELSKPIASPVIHESSKSHALAEGLTRSQLRRVHRGRVSFLRVRRARSALRRLGSSRSTD